MNKMGKKIFTILLAVTLFFSTMIQFVTAEGEDSEDCTPGTEVVQNDQAEDNAGDSVGSNDVGNTDDDEDNKASGDIQKPTTETNSNITKEEEETNTVQPKDIKDWVTVTFSMFDDKGNQYQSGDTLKEGNVKMEFRFAVADGDDKDVHAGDWFVIAKLPSNFVGLEEYWNQHNPFPDNFPAELIVEENGDVKVKFAEGIEELSNIIGYFEAECSVSLDNSDEENIVIDIGGVNGTAISLKPAVTEETESYAVEVEKKGELDKDGYITWTIKATPDTKHENTSLAGYVLREDFSAYADKMEYVEGSFSVEGIAEDDIVEPEVEKGKFSYIFPDNIGKGKQTITFKTKLTQSVFNGETTVKNTVSLHMPKNEASASADSAEVILNYIRKDKSYKGDTFFERNRDGSIDIHYVVTVHYTGKDVYLTDIFQKPEDSYSLIDADNCNYKDVKIQYDNGEIKNLSSPRGYTVRNKNISGDKPEDSWTAKELRIPLKRGTHSAKVYYTVHLEHLSDADQNYYENLLVRNNATLHIGNAEGSDWEDCEFPLVGSDGIVYLKKIGSFVKDDDGNYVRDDAGNYLINWTVNINDNHHNLGRGKLTITDTLSQPSGAKQEYVEDTILLTGSERKHGKEVKNNNGIQKAEIVKDGSSFTIDVKNPGSRKFVLTYTTKVSDFIFDDLESSKLFENELNIKWSGGEETVTKGTERAWSALLSKEGTYDADASEYGEKAYFDWTIKFNGTDFDFHDAVIHEKLPKGHHLVDGSVMLRDEAIPAAAKKPELVENVCYVITDDGIDVYFPEPLVESQTIKLRTEAEFTEENISNKSIEATNTAILTAKEISDDSTLETSATVNVKFQPSVEKKAVKNGDVVTWQINLNENKNVISSQNATLEDILPEELAFVEGSAKLEKVIGDKQFETIRMNDPSYDPETRMLRFTLPDNLDLTGQYRLTFETKVVESVNGLVNIITFRATAEEKTSSSEAINVRVNGASWDAVGDNIRFSIQKTDNEGKPLEGAEFGIYDSDEKLLDKVISDQNGIVVFKKAFKYNRHYTFKELKTPVGYLPNNTTYKMYIGEKNMDSNSANVEIQAENETFTRSFTCDANNTLQIEYTVENIPTEIGFTKVTDTVEGLKPLRGATFAVYEADKDGQKVGEAVDTWISDGLVHIIKAKLNPNGTYVLTEIKPPAGYRYAKDILFKVDENGKIEIIGESGEIDADGNIQMTDIRIPYIPPTPEIPWTPIEPGTPVEPEEPEVPTVPEKPEKPEKPSKPSKPQKPSKPETPNKPVRPGLPGDDYMGNEGRRPNGSGSEYGYLPGDENMGEDQNTPRTGDQTMLYEWIVLLITSSLAVTTIVAYKRKQEE